MTPDATGAPGAGSGDAADDIAPADSGRAGGRSSALIVPGSTAVAEPIVVRNELWSAADPTAYDGGRQTDITHLAEVEASGIASRDDARCSRSSRRRPTTSSTCSGPTACGRCCRALPVAPSR